MKFVTAKRIFDENGGYYQLFSAKDFEFANPIEYYSESMFASRFTMLRDMLIRSGMKIPEELINQVAANEANSLVESELAKAQSTPIPDNFLRLLQSESKKDQVRLLKGQGLTPEQLFAFIIKSWTDFGFSLSQFRVEFDHQGLSSTDLPKLIELEKGEVKKIGSTTLSDGQLKNVVLHREVRIVKFLDNGSNWHCFFTCYKSLRGEETWKDGQPHHHYISSKFGHTRGAVEKQLRSETYKLGTLPHVDILEYR